MKRLSNPLSFTPWPVTIITSVVYVVLIAALLFVHHVLPPPRQIPGTDLDEAWHDLQTLSSAYHPYNSHRNDEVREWLLHRIESIIHPTNVSGSEGRQHGPLLLQKQGRQRRHSGLEPAIVFSDTASNLSSSINGSILRPAVSTYFESTNIIVYVRGSEDDPAEWWLEKRDPEDDGGVLVNAHYDSVSTGFGATDDGVGVVTILQLIKYFSSPDHQPKKGIVALLNNGEEDFLNGARVFFQHPISKFPKTFLNLEGAGAGGRATLFRSTNTEVTKSYQRSTYPMGSVISADGFKRGLIRSETDYSIFAPNGMQGLDVAFFEPRARYHTNEDDARHTNKASLYHMLSAALPTIQGLTDAPDQDREDGSDGVWFDIFGSAFAVFQLRTLYALSITVVVVAPVTIGLIFVLLYRSDRQYILSGSVKPKSGRDAEPVSIKGRRGVFRWPIAFIFASALVTVLAFLVVKLNPYIIYSSPYAVWAMFVSAWLSLAWVCVTTADHFRPTAFQRLYAIMWIGLAAWLAHIVAAIYENKQKLGGAYLMFFYHAAIFLAAMISLLELFGLPKKQDYASELQNANPTSRRGTIPESGSVSSAQLLGPPDDEGQGHHASETAEDEEGEDADERTSLLGGGRGGLTSFKHYHSSHDRHEAEEHSADAHRQIRKVYHLEQPWSHSLPTYLWLLEFLLIAPFPLIVLGHDSLIFTSAIYQTLADGGNPLLPYLSIALLTILILSPLAPFLHRYTYHLPLFLVLVLIGTTIYNLVAFPFSENNRLKINFIQHLDLDTGNNNVTLRGISHGSYLHNVITSLPSAYDQTPHCEPAPAQGTQQCSFTGLPPNLLGQSSPPSKAPFAASSNTTYAHLLTFSISSVLNKTNTARFRIRGKGTRNCKLLFDKPISAYKVDGSGKEDPRFPSVPQNGTSELRLWSRTWDREWRGEVSWKGGNGGLSGRAVCLWSDANTPGTIPALDEVWKFAPKWVAVSKAGDGLVEGGKPFKI